MKEHTLHIAPAGGFAKEVQALAKNQGFSNIVLYDDQALAELKAITDLPQNGSVALAIGSSSERSKIHRRLKSGITFPNLIDPSAILLNGDSIEIGKGCIISAGSILTTDITVGNFVIINLHCSIGHDVQIGDFCSLMPGVRISGGVKLDDEVYLGSNAVVLPNTKIGKGATIGAGAVVTKDVPPGKTYAGVPAKEIA